MRVRARTRLTRREADAAGVGSAVTAPGAPLARARVRVPREAARRGSLRVCVRRVAVVQHEVVAVGVGEDRHVADAGVEGVAEEGDALGLELRARRVDVLHAQWQRIAGLRHELHPYPLGLPDDEAGVARPLLVLRMLIGAHA